MKRATKFAFGAITALALGLGTAAVGAHPYGQVPGAGMEHGHGYGPGNGPGAGMGCEMAPGSGAGPMGHGPMGHGPMGQGQMGHGPMGHGPMAQGQMGHGQMGCGQMGHGQMGHGQMGHGPMGHGPMGHGPMGHGPMAQGPMGHGPMGHGMGAQAQGNPAAAADWRLSNLKSELKIAAAQEPAWKAFADQTKQQAEAMHAWRTTMQGSAQATAPERLELRNQVMKKRQEQMEKGTAVFKDLYAVLSPEQKALADQRVGFGMMGGRGMAFNRPSR